MDGSGKAGLAEKVKTDLSTKINKCKVRVCPFARTGELLSKEKLSAHLDEVSNVVVEKEMVVDVVNCLEIWSEKMSSNKKMIQFFSRERRLFLVTVLCLEDECFRFSNNVFFGLVGAREKWPHIFF